MKFSNEEFFSKCDQIDMKLWIRSHLLKKSLDRKTLFFVQCKFWGFCWHAHLLLVSSEKFVKMDVFEYYNWQQSMKQGGLTYHFPPHPKKNHNPRLTTQLHFWSSSCNQFKTENLKKLSNLLGKFICKIFNCFPFFWRFVFLKHFAVFKILKMFSYMETLHRKNEVFR